MSEAPPLVSVVTPFYNTEAFLAECIESVLRQTHQNWEYVLVNNQSTDRSAEIARLYAAQDSRIRLIETPRFLSQNENYNFALEQISTSSKYCKVVQADDWIFPECLARMVSVADGDPSIGVVSGYRIQGRLVNNDGLPYSDAPIPGREICRLNLLLDGRQLFGSPTTVMVRSELVRKRRPFYPPASISDDSDAMFEVLRDCAFGFVFQVCAYERVGDDGISSCVDRHDPFWFLAKFTRIKKYGPEYLSAKEYEGRMRSVERAYLRFLARSSFSRRDREFWAFHRDGLRAQGYELTWLRLLPFIGWQIVDFVLNPKATIGSLYRWISEASARRKAETR